MVVTKQMRVVMRRLLVVNPVREMASRVTVPTFEEWKRRKLFGDEVTQPHLVRRAPVTSQLPLPDWLMQPEEA